jgi:GNAT superfamily N-acetyltransferase
MKKIGDVHGEPFALFPRNEKSLTQTALIYNCPNEKKEYSDATALITEPEAALAPLYPQESRHGLSVERLIGGGVKLFGTAYGEIKRMYVRPQFRGQGFAKLMLNHLSDYASSQGATLLRQVTGIHHPSF